MDSRKCIRCGNPFMWRERPSSSICLLCYEECFSGGPGILGVLGAVFGFACIVGLLVCLGVLVVCALGCSYGPVYEYRVSEELKNEDGSHRGWRMYSGDTMPDMRDDRVWLVDGDTMKVLPVEDVEIKKVQVGPHECKCGTILRTYRDRCGECGQMILMGCRTPPGDSDG